ncbi:MAG: helix-turn-helix domain-containing protein [Caulobacter sp.]
MARASNLSAKADIKSSDGGRQRLSPEGFGERLRQALKEKGLKNADLARLSGLAPQLISEYASGRKIAGADNLFSIADALGVYPRWLIRGEGPAYEIPADPSEQIVDLERYNVFYFDEYSKGPVIDHIALPAKWLYDAARTTSGLWLAEMPSDALPSVAREGETIICRDPEVPLQDRRVYIFLLGGRPIVRRFFLLPDKVSLRGDVEGDTIEIPLVEFDDRVMPVARVVAALSLSPA